MLRAHTGGVYVDGNMISSGVDRKFAPSDSVELDLRLGDGLTAGELWCKLPSKEAFKMSTLEPGSSGPYYCYF